MKKKTQKTKYVSFGEIINGQQILYVVISTKNYIFHGKTYNSPQIDYIVLE